jgi:DNA-binding response OmpR family regulator/anti-anti-sigma regulatory factor
MAIENTCRGEEMPPHAGDGLILIVDDSPANLGVLSNALVQSGFDVAVARDGTMALDQVQVDAPDLILLDVLMPGIDGFEVCRQLKANPSTREIPIVFMTALSDAVDKVMGLELGAVDYITKPFQQEEVLARIKSQFKLRSLTRTLVERNTRLEFEISERALAEAALKDLAGKLEERVAERTAELSRVVRELEDAQVKLKGSNQRLEAEVAAQLEELRKTNATLGVELAERRRIEESRAALQEEIIQVQRARLAEMSTPFIPITDEIMVMPLVGVMEKERAEQVLATALEGVAAKQGRVVIIDITGVQRVDASVASALVRTAQALRLLGSQAVITGIRPEVAQMLVGLSLELGGIVTQGTLQSGIAYALKLSGRRGWDV